MTDKADLRTHFTEGYVASLIDDGAFTKYHHKKLVRAFRVEGPFTVETPDGIDECDDGYLILDEDGWPSSVDITSFRNQYEKH